MPRVSFAACVPLLVLLALAPPFAAAGGTDGDSLGDGDGDGNGDGDGDSNGDGDGDGEFHEFPRIPQTSNFPNSLNTPNPWNPLGIFVSYLF